MDVTWYRDGERLELEEADGNLFDLDADPRERFNLWSEPAMQPTVKRLWRLLERWSAEIDHPEPLFGARN
jgi:hypothetical protein